MRSLCVLALVLAACEIPMRVTDVRGKRHDLWGDGITVVAWTGATCPMAKLYAPRLHALAKEYKSRGVRFFLVNSNARDGDPPDLGFPAIRDTDARLARWARVTRTTEVLVFDARGSIRYRGAIDDQYGYTHRRREPANEYLRDALNALLDGKLPKVKRTDPLGCAIGLDWKRGGTGAVTFHEHIEPLVQKHCQDCHHEGGRAPFALEAYDDAHGMARMIREVATERRMPPWNADPRHGKWKNARVMRPDEIATIQRWVDAGAPRGDPAKAPKRREFRRGWELPDPDVILTTPRMDVPADGRVPYRYVRIKTAYPEDRWVRAAQFRTESAEVLHHVLTFIEEDPKQPVPEGRPWRPKFNPLDLLEGAPRKDWKLWIRRHRKYLPHMMIGQAGGMDGYFLAELPGDRPSVYPKGRARLLPAGATLVFQLHYTPTGEATKSKTSLALWFAKSAPKEVLDIRAAATVVFAIPPGKADYVVEATYVLQRDATLLSLRPHMHLRGKAFTYWAEYPGGKRETLLHVPEYNFDWQFEYVLAEPKELPKGTRLRARGVYDNSAANPNNPDPTQTVYFGLQSEEEMFIGYCELIWR